MQSLQQTYNKILFSPLYPFFVRVSKYSTIEWEDDKQYAESPAGGDAINQAARVKREAVAA